MPRDFFAPKYRLQDELHLLRDSLGAVDCHYESLLDHLLLENGGTPSKIVASSATLSGFERQSRQLFCREGRVFPCLGPTAHETFWSRPTESVARRFVALAPRGATLDFVSDRILTHFQRQIRRLVTEPKAICAEIGIPAHYAPMLVSRYGTNTIYGNTLRDLEAVERSLSTGRIPVSPLRSTSLTGQTGFNEIRRAIDAIQSPADDFDDRIHVVTASSMMSHGVDLDRLNVMTMLGLPLTTAEFIQTTSRIGRRWPGIVYVLHKMNRERDADTHKVFRQFVEQGDRFIDPIPVTRRSRRVLNRTLPGVFFARQLHVHEARADKSLAGTAAFRAYRQEGRIDPSAELSAILECLGFNGDASTLLRQDVERWIELYFESLDDRTARSRFPRDLSSTGGPMTSLRDVEDSAPINIGLPNA